MGRDVIMCNSLLLLGNMDLHGMGDTHKAQGGTVHTPQRSGVKCCAVNIYTHSWLPCIGREG